MPDCRARSGSRRRGSHPKGEVHWNLVAPDADPGTRSAAARASSPTWGRSCAVTAPHTGRSPNDKFVVKEPSSEKRRRLGQGQPADLAEAQFETLLADVRAVSRTSATSCSSRISTAAPIPKYRLSVRYVSPNAWHMAFVRNMFIRPDASELPTFEPNFTVLHAPEFQADPARHGTRTSTFIVLNLAKRMILIGGTRYAGELKKSMFTVMNYYMPKQGVLSMHCSANIGDGRRHRALLRPLGHGQDDALRRSAALAHRRRRARLVARRHVQLRGRLLREGDQPLARGRAGHLSHDADVRHDPRERRARSDARGR